MSRHDHSAGSPLRLTPRWTDGILDHPDATSVVESIVVAFLAVDREWRLIYVNPAAARLLGRDRAELLGRCVWDVVPAEFGTALEPEYRRAMTEHAATHLEAYYPPLDAWGAIHIYPSAAGLAIYVEDVTERKQAEVGRARLLAILEETSDVVGTAAPDGRMLYLNRAGRRLLGIPADAPLEANIADVHPDWARQVLFEEAIPATVRDGIWSGETTLRTAAGGELPVSQVIIAHRTADGTVDALSSIMRDLTPKTRLEAEYGRAVAATRAVEAELRLVEAKLRLTLDASPVSSWEYDVQAGRWREGGDPKDARSGRSAGGAGASTTPFDAFLARVHADDRARVLDALMRGLVGRTEATIEFRIVEPGTSLRSRQAKGRMLVDASGQPTRIVGIGVDISERRALEQQLQNQKLETIGQLAAGIAHELNTPTQYVSGNVRFLEQVFREMLALLGEYQRLAEAARERGVLEDVLPQVEDAAAKTDLEYLLEEIPAAAHQSLEGLERIAAIVRSVKAFSRAETLEKAPADLNTEVEHTVTLSRNEWKYVADLELDLDRNLPQVPCVAHEIGQVVLNLIINASHAIGDAAGGMNPGPRGKITVSTRHDGEWAEIRVKDTGCGIPEAVRPRVFDPFFTTKDVGKGTGQGLAIARAVVVDKHGGTITFETEVGVGTTFIVRLPLIASTTASATPADGIAAEAAA